MTGSTTLSVRNKYTGEVIREIQADNIETLREKIKKASDAKEKMRKTDLGERIEFIRKVGRAVRMHKKELVELIVKEGGLPYKYARWDCGMIQHGYLTCDVQADMIRDKEVEAISGKNIMTYEPIGLVSGLSPRNTPMSLPMYTIGAAWLAGDSVIVKPSSAVPLTPLKVLEIASEVEGIPAVESTEICLMPGDEATNEFISNPLIDLFAFIGSSHVGKKLLIDYGKYMESTAMKMPFFDGGLFINGKFKLLLFEMAGNDSGIIMNDVDVDKVADMVVRGSFTNSGQQCFSMKRILAHKDIAKNLADKIVDKASKLKIGDPMDPETEIGPLGSKKIIDTIDFMVQDALKKGGQLLMGGKREDPFYPPTLIKLDKKRVRAQSMVEKPFMWMEESFGSARSILEFETVDEAVQLANDTQYGMRTGIYCEDTELAMRIVKKIDVAIAFINEDPQYQDITLPFGGRKSSGWPPGAKYWTPYFCCPKFYHIGDFRPKTLDNE
ncbi:MAG: aldehyde dehydrogenase family protein [Candidatus Atabeyarchaeum deiterrae]